MKKFYFFIAFVFLIFSFGCSNEKVTETSNFTHIKDFNIVRIHDEACFKLINFVDEWKNSKEEPSILIHRVFDEIMVSDLAREFEISEEEIISMYNDLGITRSNYTSYYKVSLEELPNEYKDFLNDMQSFYQRCKSLDEIQNGLEIIKKKWYNRLDPEIVSIGIEVAKSSFPFWFEHTKSLISNSNRGVTTRGTCKLAIALADVTGGIFGAISAGILSGGAGALPGGMLGAEGGTLGAATIAAILGTCE